MRRRSLGVCWGGSPRTPVAGRRAEHSPPRVVTGRFSHPLQPWSVIFARLCLERGPCPHFINLCAPFISAPHQGTAPDPGCLLPGPFPPSWVLSVHSHFSVFPGQSDIPKAVSCLSCNVKARLDHTFCFLRLWFFSPRSHKCDQTSLQGPGG